MNTAQTARAFAAHLKTFPIRDNECLFAGIVEELGIEFPWSTMDDRIFAANFLLEFARSDDSTVGQGH